VRHRRFDFFADTLLMLNASRGWTTVEQLVTWMGTGPCVVRAQLELPNFNCTGDLSPGNCTVLPWDSPERQNNSSDETLPFCTLWAEGTVLSLPGDASNGTTNGTLPGPLTSGPEFFDHLVLNFSTISVPFVKACP
jgi:hypothetical protein